MSRFVAHPAVVLVIGMSVSAVPRTLQAQGAPSNWTLNSVIATVEAQHPLVEVARAKLNAAQGAHRTAGSLSNPTATYCRPGPAIAAAGPAPTTSRSLTATAARRSGGRSPT